jgi:hypothetical protein
MNGDEIMKLQQEGFLNTRELTSKDRCDGCNAEALMRATKGTDELLFCGHHGKKSELNLIASGWRVQDDTFKLYGPAVPENV